MLTSKQPDPIAMLEKGDRQEVLLEAVRKLAADRQQLLVLKFIEQMTNAEIGQVMGRTEGAIKSLYHRTLVSLRQELASEEL